MPKPLRMFLAVELPQILIGRIKHLLEELKQLPDDIRWVEPGQFHVTVKFLGNVRWEELHQICLSTDWTCKQMKAFDAEMGTLGAFPNLETPHVLWVGFTEGTEAMRQLAASLDLALEPLGFRPENRQFRPHLTLGYVRSGETLSPELKAYLETHREFHAGQLTVDGVTVFSSQMGRQGPVYEALGHSSLRS